MPSAENVGLRGSKHERVFTRLAKVDDFCGDVFGRTSRSHVSEKCEGLTRSAFGNSILKRKNKNQRGARRYALEPGPECGPGQHVLGPRFWFWFFGKG